MPDLIEPPESLEDGFERGVYTVAREPQVQWGVDSMGEWMNLGYYVPFHLRRLFLQQMLAVSSYQADSDGGAGNGMWSIRTPYECPMASGLYAFTANGQGTGTWLDSEPGHVEFSDALIQIQFRTPFYNFAGFYDPWFLHSITPNPIENSMLMWATQDVDYSVETLAIPNRRLEFVRTSPDQKREKLSSPAVRNLLIDELFITFQRVPYLPRGFLLYRDCVNAEPFLGFPKGTVYLAGMKTSIRSWVGGFRTRTVSLHFRIRSQADWNMDLKKDGKWGLVGNFTETGELDEDRPYFFFYKDMRPLLALNFLAA